MTRDGYPNCNFDQHRSCCTLAPKQHYIHMTYTHIMYMHLEPKVFLVLIEKVWKVLFWVGSTPQNKTRPWIALKYFFNVYNTAVWYIYIYLEPICPLFCLQKKVFSNQNKGHLGSRCIYINILWVLLCSTFIPFPTSGLVWFSDFVFFFHLGNSWGQSSSMQFSEPGGNQFTAFRQRGRRCTARHETTRIWLDYLKLSRKKNQELN